MPKIEIDLTDDEIDARAKFEPREPTGVRPMIDATYKLDALCRAYRAANPRKIAVPLMLPLERASRLAKCATPNDDDLVAIILACRAALAELEGR